MVPGQPYISQDWTFRGGFAPGSTTPSREPDTPQVDLASLNLDALATYLAGAAESTRVPDGTISHLIMRADTTAGPEVMIYVENEAGMNGYLSVTPDGQQISVVPADG
jgi:hypothetical protein